MSEREIDPCNEARADLLARQPGQDVAKEIGDIAFRASMIDGLPQKLVVVAKRIDAALDAEKRRNGDVLCILLLEARGLLCAMESIRQLELAQSYEHLVALKKSK